MKKIESLTEAQIAKFPEYVERWTKIGLCTYPADRPAAESAIREMYTVASLPAPRIVWCESPLGQGLTRAILMSDKLKASVGDSVWDSVGNSVWNSVWASVGDSVWASVGDSVWASVWDSVGASVGASVWASVGASVRASVRASVGASVRASVGDSVGNSVWNSVWDSVRASVGASVRASVGDSVWASVGDSVWASVRGQHEAGFSAFYDFFKNECGLIKQTEKASGIINLCKSSGWILPHQKICWVSERHSKLSRDDRGRLHSDSGPACAYPDGFAIHSWHGVRVQPHVIEKPESITIDEVSKEQNAEVRRIKIERMGVSKFVSESGATVVEVDDHKFNGTRALFRSKFGSWLHCACPSTARTYWMDVPDDVKTCEEADTYLRGGRNGKIVGAT